MDKIHHKTLEAQKRREAEALAEAIPANEVTPDTVVEVKKSIIDDQNSLIAQQQAMLNAMAAKVDAIETKQNAPKVDISRHIDYKGASEFSYYLFTRSNDDGEKDIPILDYRTIKRDDKRSGLTYREHGETVNNQVLKLTLADGTTEKVEPFYLAEAKASIKAFPLFVEDAEGNRIKGNSDQARNMKNLTNIIFTSEYGEIKIPTKLIATSFVPK